MKKLAIALLVTLVLFPTAVQAKEKAKQEKPETKLNADTLVGLVDTSYGQRWLRGPPSPARRGRAILARRP